VCHNIWGNCATVKWIVKWGHLVNPILEGEEKHLRYCLIGIAQQGNNDPVHLSLKYSQSIRTSKGFTLFSIPWRTCVSHWVGHTCKTKGMISLHAMYKLHIHVKYPLAHSYLEIYDRVGGENVAILGGTESSIFPKMEGINLRASIHWSVGENS